MSAGSAGPAGVKNLRAMFENKSNQTDQSTSPPSRGRSSRNGSISSSTSRPVSKVRTNFVAVEKSGDSGQPLQLRLRTKSDVSSITETREETMEQGKSNTAAQDSGDAFTLNGGLGAILKGSAFETIPEALPPKMESKPQPTDKVANTTSGRPTVNGAGNVPTSPVKTKSTLPTKPDTSQMNGIKSTKPALSSVSTKPASSKPKESPVLSVNSLGTPKDNIGTGQIKPRGGAAKIQGVIESSNRAKEERAKFAQEQADKEEKKTAPKQTKPPSVATKPTATSKAHSQTQDLSSSTRSQLKSPISTRAPTKLPSAATAVTAASAARKGASTEQEEAKVTTTEKRTTATTSQVPRVAHATTRASLARKSSRASLTNGDETPKPRLSMTHKPADEGFLARLTRPTASSAQRANEKVQTTSPPRSRKTSHPLKGRKSLSNTAPNARSEQSGEESVLEPVKETIEGTRDESTVDGDDTDDVLPPQQAAVLKDTI